MKHRRMMVSGLALLFGSLLGSSCAGCPGSTTEEQCAICEGRPTYSCPVGSTNNIICANDDAHALTLCPEGPTRLNCEGGSGGQAVTPDSKTPDAKLDSTKAKQ